MGFDRSRLPDPADFYTSTAGLRLTGHGKWRTAPCPFHGGSDSMRVNLASGAFVCMAGCGAKGGDVLAFEMLMTGADFRTAAECLGAWIDDGKPATRTRPTPLPARDAIQVLRDESTLVAVAAGNVAQGVQLSNADRERVMAAARRIRRIAEVFA